MKLQASLIANGDIGTWQTLWTMRRLAREGAQDLEVCKFASHITRGMNDPLRIISRLEQLVFSNVRYVDDPAEYEFVRTPQVMVRAILKYGRAEGDCDDHVTLLSALMTCQGIPNAVIALVLPDMAADFSHVVNGIALGNGQYMLLDTSVKTAKFQYEAGISTNLTVDVL